MTQLLHLFLKEIANFTRIIPRKSELNEDYLNYLLNLYNEMNKTSEKRNKIRINLRSFDYSTDAINKFIYYFTVANDPENNISLLDLSKFMVHPKIFPQM